MKLVFGTSRLHHSFTSRERQALLQECYRQGIRDFDTAPLYGFGLSETELGVFKQKHRVNITTKVGLHSQNSNSTHWLKYLNNRLKNRTLGTYKDFSAKKMERSLQCSLERLDICHIDTLLLHEVDEVTFCHHEFNMFFKNTRHLYNKIGVSGRLENLIPIVNKYSSLFQVVQTSLHEPEIRDFFHAAGLEIRVYGFFTQKERMYPNKKDKLLFSTKNRNRVRMNVRDLRHETI